MPKLIITFERHEDCAFALSEIKEALKGRNHASNLAGLHVAISDAKAVTCPDMTDAQAKQLRIGFAENDTGSQQQANLVIEMQREQERRGNQLAAEFYLKPEPFKPGHFRCRNGSKMAYGIFATALRIIEGDWP